MSLEEKPQYLVSESEKQSVAQTLVVDGEDERQIRNVPFASVFGGRWASKLTTWGVEERGTQPVPDCERIDTQYSKLFFIFMSSNFTTLTVSTGSLGPAVFQLSVQNSCLVILVFNIFCTILPAYLATWGSKLGMRQMILSRYTFGYYGVIFPCILNIISAIGFSTLSCIVGGQTIASVTDDRLSWTVGIVIFTIISLLVSFVGYKFLNWFERFAWIPILIAFIIVAGISGKHLGNPPPLVPVSVNSVLGFAGIQAGFVITWSGLVADFGCYLRPDNSGWRIFCFSYLGMILPSVLLQSLGAALAGIAPGIPLWSESYAGGNIGGLMNTVLQPLGGFGKFLTVLLGLSVTGNLAAIFYSASLNYQVLFPPLVVIPRYVFSVITTAIVLPISIVGAHRFYTAIINFLGLIGYWASAYAIILILEHLCFRSNDFSKYDRDAWNNPKRLPKGYSALGAGVLSFGLVVPCMSQVWYTGIIARTTGDIGFEVALVASMILYPPLRWLEIRLMGMV